MVVVPSSSSGLFSSSGTGHRGKFFQLEGEKEKGKEGGNRDIDTMDHRISSQMYWIEESERSCQEHLARYHHLQNAWQGNPR